MLKKANILRTYSQSEINEHESEYIRNFGSNFKKFLDNQNCIHCGRNVFQSYDRLNGYVSYGNSGDEELKNCPHCDMAFIELTPCKVMKESFDGFKPNTLYKFNNDGEIVEDEFEGVIEKEISNEVCGYIKKYYNNKGMSVKECVNHFEQHCSLWSSIKELTEYFKQDDETINESDIKEMTCIFTLSNGELLYIG